MHPHNLVFNPATMKRLVELTTPEGGVNHVGAEMDPSHLFWQHIDPIQAVEDLGELMFFAAAKDTLIHETAAINGVLDDRFEWIPAEENPVGLGGRYTVTRWPAVPGLVVRRGRPRSRRRLLVAVPDRRAQGRPRPGGEHRARGRLVRSGRGSGVRCGEPDRRRRAGRRRLARRPKRRRTGLRVLLVEARIGGPTEPPKRSP